MGPGEDAPGVASLVITALTTASLLGASEANDSADS